MSVELWHAILNPSGPNYERLKDIFPDRVPLTSAQPIKAQLGPEKDVPVYMLDLGALPLNRRAALLSLIANKFGVTISEVQAEMKAKGFPIREADVIVSYGMRAFV